MSRLDFPVVTDENVHPNVIDFLREMGVDVLDIKEQHWFGLSDEEILARAYEQGRVVVTHDSDFGRLAILSGKPLIGIIFLRPADIQVDRTIEKLSRFFATQVTLHPPFIVVIQDGKVRVRNL